MSNSILRLFFVKVFLAAQSVPVLIYWCAGKGVSFIYHHDLNSQ